MGSIKMCNARFLQELQGHVSSNIKSMREHNDYVGIHPN